MGIRNRPISPGSPWQNAHAQRVIGIVRHACLDRMPNFGKRHLRHVPASGAAIYNQVRRRLALDKEPSSRAVRRSRSTIPMSIGTVAPPMHADRIFGRDPSSISSPRRMFVLVKSLKGRNDQVFSGLPWSATASAMAPGFSKVANAIMAGLVQRDCRHVFGGGA